MLYGNTIHFQYQKHVWGNKPCKRERDILFNCIFGMLGQWFISNESIKCVSPSCSVNAISHILTSLFTRNKAQLAIKKRQHTRGSKGEMMRHPAAQPKSRVEWGWECLAALICHSLDPAALWKGPFSLFREALGKLGKTAHASCCLCP